MRRRRRLLRIKLKRHATRQQKQSLTHNREVDDDASLASDSRDGLGLRHAARPGYSLNEDGGTALHAAAAAGAVAAITALCMGMGGRRGQGKRVSFAAADYWRESAKRKANVTAKAVNNANPE